jgi:hypothetical protein
MGAGPGYLSLFGRQASYPTAHGCGADAVSRRTGLAMSPAALHRSRLTGPPSSVWESCGPSSAVRLFGPPPFFRPPVRPSARSAFCRSSARRAHAGCQGLPAPGRRLHSSPSSFCFRFESGPGIRPPSGREDGKVAFQGLKSLAPVARPPGEGEAPDARRKMEAHTAEGERPP